VDELSEVIAVQLSCFSRILPLRTIRGNVPYIFVAISNWCMFYLIEIHGKCGTLPTREGQMSVQRLKRLHKAITDGLCGTTSWHGTHGGGAHNTIIIIGNKGELNAIPTGC